MWPKTTVKIAVYWVCADISGMSALVVGVSFSLGLAEAYESLVQAGINEHERKVKRQHRVGFDLPLVEDASCSLIPACTFATPRASSL